MESFLVAAAIMSPALLFVGFIVAGAGRAVRGAAKADTYFAHAMAQCAANRRASITASVPQAKPRRVTMPLGADYIVPRPQDVDAIKAGSVTYDIAAITADVPPELPSEASQNVGIPVDWPTQVVQPVPLTRL